MNYPLDLRFKLLAIAAQISVSDASGNLVFYVKQKAFKLKEDITVFADREQSRALFTIKADRMIDWSAKYTLAAAGGASLGTVGRKGMRSLFKALYEISDGQRQVATLKEESAWVRFFDGLFGDLPIIGILSGYLFHPSYLITRSDGTPILRVKKRPALLEGKFVVEQLAAMDPTEETRSVLALLTMLLLERSRG
jgi:hypothetical protein